MPAVPPQPGAGGHRGVLAAPLGLDPLEVDVQVPVVLLGECRRRALALGYQERADVLGCHVFDAVRHTVITKDRRQRH